MWIKPRWRVDPHAVVRWALELLLGMHIVLCSEALELGLFFALLWALELRSLLHEFVWHVDQTRTTHDAWIKPSRRVAQTTFSCCWHVDQTSGIKFPCWRVDQTSLTRGSNLKRSVIDAWIKPRLNLQGRGRPSWSALQRLANSSCSYNTINMCYICTIYVLYMCYICNIYVLYMYYICTIDVL